MLTQIENFVSPTAQRYMPIKRVLDVLLSGCGILILSPILGIVALAIKLESPGPVIFKQKRFGKNKEFFEIYKFRSMRTDTPKDLPTHLLDDPDRFITKTGRFIRKTSLDELPQLFNIFLGKMSVIGPRPALWNQGEYVRKMSFLFDCKCFFGTVISVLRHDGVVEGGTGTLEKENKKDS